MNKKEGNIIRMFHSSPHYFENFDNAFIRELGFHFGSREQAINNIRKFKPDNNKDRIGYLYECDIKIGRSFGNDMTDLGNWSYEMLEEYFNPIHGNYDDVFKQSEWNSIKIERDFVNAMIDKKYNSIKYLNVFEEEDRGGKSSYIVFDANNICIRGIEKCTLRYQGDIVNNVVHDNKVSVKKSKTR